MIRTTPLARVNAFGALWMGVIVMPVYVPFLGSRGISVSDVLSLQSVFAVSMLIFEVPAGYACDVLGRRRTILIGAGLNLLGYVGFAAARGFAAFAAVQIVLASGLSLVSGADIALIYDVLDRQDAGRQARRHALAAYVVAQTLGEAAMGLLGAIIAGWSLPAVGWATAAEAVLPLLVAVTLPDGAAKPHAVRLTDIPPAWRKLFGHPGLGLLFANIIAWGLSTFIAVWLLQPYWQQQGVPIRWFGLLWAATLLTVAATGRNASRITNWIGGRGALLVIALAPVAAYAGMAGLGGAAGIAVGFLLYVSRGLNSVNLTEAFNHRVPAALRATFNSIRTGLFRFSFALAGPLVGSAIRYGGLHWTFALLAAVFLAVFVVLTIPLLRRFPAM